MKGITKLFLAWLKPRQVHVLSFETFNDGKNVVFKVNDEVVTETEFNREMERVRARTS